MCVETDCISGPDSEDLLRDSSEHLGGAPPSGPRRPLLSADSKALMSAGYQSAAQAPV